MGREVEAVSDPTSLIRQMFERSSRKLNSPKNLVKPSWIGMDDYEIRSRIRDEIAELEAELEKPIGEVSWDAVADEAADVYHFASMGADPRRPRRI